MLLGCKTTSDKKYIISSDETKTASIETTDTDTTIPKRIENDEKSTKWTNTFSKNTLGLLQTGDSISKALDLLNDLFIVKFDSIEACEGCFDEFEYYYSVYKNHKLIFTLHPGYEENNKDLIFRFELYDADYKSDKGIGIGNTVTDLKEKYKLTEAYFAYDLGLFLFAKDFDGSFGLSYESYSDINDFNFEQATPETIPEKCIIDKIVIL